MHLANSDDITLCLAHVGGSMIIIGIRVSVRTSVFNSLGKVVGRASVRSAMSASAAIFISAKLGASRLATNNLALVILDLKITRT